MNTDTTFTHSRLFSASLEKIYAAYTTPSLLMQRRGPKGFSNEFEYCYPVTGGNWKFTMIGPDGAKHPNESMFVEVSKERIVIEHVCKPHYILNIQLQEETEGTRITRQQQFDTPSIYNQLKGFVAPANEENFDRLERLLNRLPL